MNSDLRIVSLLPSSTEIVCALGLGKNLVGVTHECDFPVSINKKPHLTSSRISHETMSSKDIDHAVRSQLDGHGSIYDLNEKLLRELKPDIIITQELCDVCAVNYKTVRKAAKIYVDDAKVISLEPNTINDIFENIKTVGEICEVSHKAREVASDLKGRLETLRKKTIKVKVRPRVFMLEWLDPPFSPGHWVPEQVELAGGTSILGSAGGRSVTTTYEAICESKPEIMCLIPCGYHIEDILRQLKTVEFPEKWKEIPAIENGNVWALAASSYFSRPSPRVVDGAEIAARIFHPEIFGAPTEKEAVRVSRDLIQFQKRIGIHV